MTRVLLRAVAIALSLACGSVQAQVAPARMTAQTLYLPVYSHIWHGDTAPGSAPQRTLMSVSVSIRNTDPKLPIRVLAAQYYDTDGRKLKNYVSTPKTIGPMGTYEIFIPRSDDTGGSGANFLIDWRADAPVNAPLVEAVHANLPAGRAIVFTTSARPLNLE